MFIFFTLDKQDTNCKTPKDIKTAPIDSMNVAGCLVVADKSENKNKHR